MEIAGKLLADGAPVDRLDGQGRPALHLAIMESHVDMAELFLNFGANIETSSGPMSIRAIHLASMTLNPSMMRTLLRYHPNLESTCNGLTALFYAVSSGNYEVVELLLEAGANAKAKTLCSPGKGESVLHMAVSSFMNSMLPLLIRYGADVN
ncbi:ankyrin, partial [Bimuria novae-zelandiae CBS 107.79]